MSVYATAALFEQRFWLQVLGDHARFIFSSLALNETGEIRQAQFFIDTMDALLTRAHQSLSNSDILLLSRQAYEAAQQIREFKLSLLRRHLIAKVDIGLTPTFINHMVNEVEEYIRILEFLVREETPPPLNPVHYHLLWLLDAKGHAAALSSDLDETERDLIEKSEVFMWQFNDLYLKAVEFSGYLRTCLMEFPALSRFNQQVDREMNRFRDFLRQLESMLIADQALGRLTPLVPDHMGREECYYLIKLAQVAQIARPDCDPTQPRIMI
ncbi:MAG TPA: DUF2935 domain-containing protein [Bacillota bacterium]|nr:DUF2935 domain-containing protein [Bacillota bacterium]